MTDMSKLCGAIYIEKEEKVFRQTLPMNSYADLNRESGVGKKRFLWQYGRKVLGKDFEEIQTIGDCVGKGVQRASLLLWCIRIALNGLKEQVPGIPASEASYALGRVEIGKGSLGSGDGCVVSWAIQGAKRFGLLLRKKYGEYDLTTYSGALARKWGKPGNGLPDELEPYTKEFPIIAAAPIDSWEDGCTAMYNGEVLIAGSNTIFQRRGSDGYLVKTMSGGHCTIWTGYDDTVSKPYWMYDNASWPAMSGDRIEDCPRCAGPVDRRMVEKMLDQGEVYAVSDIKGMPAQSDELNMFEMI